MSSIRSQLSWRTPNPDSPFHVVIMVGVVTLLSFLTAKLGGTMVLRPQMIWPLWPGCAFLVAVLLLMPRRIWPLLIASGLAGFVLYDLEAGLTLRSIALLLLGDTVEILIVVLGLSYAFDGLPRLNSTESLAKYSFFAVILCPLAGTSIATAAFGGNYWIRWRIGFFTEALALLTLTPAILSWVSIGGGWIRKSRASYFEGATLIAGLTLLAYIAFVAHSHSSLPVLLYSLLPFLLWSALRFGMMGISTSMIVVAFLSISGAVRGLGPFTGAEPLKNVMSLQLFLFVTATTFMVLAVLVEERKQAFRALRESEERLCAAAEVGRMYAWEWDPATDSVLRSAQCADIFAVGEGIAKDYFGSVHPDDRAGLLRLVGSLTPEGPIYRTRYRRLRLDGTLLFLEESGCATFDGDGKMVRLIGMTADITGRNRAEEALRKSEERFSKAFRSNPLAATISTEAEGRYLDVNEAFLQMLGYQRHEVIGHTALEVGFWAQASRRAEMIRQLKENGRVTGFGMQYTTSKREIREAEVSADFVELDGQRCMLTITRDLTETQQLEAQFRQAQKMEAVGRLAGGVAHDFNNLLGVIIGSSDLSLSLIAPESPLRRHLEQIKKSSNRALSLTRQLLAFSRQQVSFPKVLDLNEVIRGETNMLQRMVGEDVAISFRPILPIGSIHADPGQIEQILMNLVVNARDAMPSGGKIVIETVHAELDERYVSQHPGSHIGHHVVLVVSDTGCGMDESTKSQIFEPFFTTKEVGKGTGLGLSTIYGIVKQSGGYITAESRPNEGATFRIYFPRVGAKAEHLEQPHDEAEFPGGSETILVVEDDEDLRDLTVHMLQDAGYRVVEATHAEAALDIVKAGNPRIDLLLTDMIMPGMSGIELLKQGKALHPALRSLLTSGYAGDRLPRRGGLVTEDAFLEKPFTRSSLLKKVYSALQGVLAKQQSPEGIAAGAGLD